MKDWENARGAIILKVDKESVAFKAGLLAGQDIILKYGDNIINNEADIESSVFKTVPGSIVPITIWRRGVGEIVLTARF